MIEPVNDIRELYISCAMERRTAAIHKYTEICRYLQRKIRSLSHMEAFKARLREEEEGNGNPQEEEPVGNATADAIEDDVLRRHNEVTEGTMAPQFGGAERTEEELLATVDPAERRLRQPAEDNLWQGRPTQEFSPIDKDGRRRTPPVLGAPPAKRARGTPVGHGSSRAVHGHGPMSRIL